MVAPGDTVLVAVSGGPDSICLLESLVRLRRLFRIRVEVFHFDHRLREGSAADAVYVRRAAERLRVPLHFRSATEAPPKGKSVEAWATAARGNAADAVRRAVGASVVAEGHTLDDQVETLLLNLIRGGGLEAMGGIRPASRTSIQPLLEVERSEVEAFCRALRLRPRRDPMNADTRLLRNAVRHEVIPAIEAATGRDPRRPIGRTAELLREARAELHVATRIEVDRIVRVDAGTIRFDRASLTALRPAVASRVVRLALWNALSLDEDLAPWSHDAIRAVLDLAAGRPGRRRDLPNGSTAVCEGQYVSVSRSSPEGRV